MRLYAEQGIVYAMSACIRFFNKSVLCFIFAGLFFAKASLALVPENTIRIHYQRIDNVYDGWRLYPWGQDLALNRIVTLQNSLPPSGKDQFGIYFDVPIKEHGISFGYFIHNAGNKDNIKDIKFDLRKYGNEIWQIQSDPSIYAQQPFSELSQSKQAKHINKVNTQLQLSANKIASPAKPNRTSNTVTASKAPTKTEKKAKQGKDLQNTLFEQEKESLNQFLRENVRRENELLAAKPVVDEFDTSLQTQKQTQDLADNHKSHSERAKPDIYLELKEGKASSEEVSAVKELNVLPEGGAAVKESKALPESNTEPANRLREKSETQLGTDSSVSDVVLSHTQVFPLWVWIALAVFALIPLLVFLVYRKQVLAFDDSDASDEQLQKNSSEKPENEAPTTSVLEAEAEKAEVCTQVNQEPVHASGTSPISLEKAVKHPIDDLKSSPFSIDEEHSEVIEFQKPQISRQESSKPGIDNETALPNKALFIKKLHILIEKAKDEGRQLALIMVDFDGFSKLNIDFELIRSELLKALVARFNKELSATNTLCRYEKDSFALCCEYNGDLKELSRFAQNLLLAGANPFSVAGETVLINTNVGISIYPDDGEKLESLLIKSHESAQRVKNKGGNGFQFTSEERNSLSVQSMAYETSLRAAIDKDELLLNYQPIVNTQSLKIRGVEALVRWQHPELALIGPAQFIKMAEEAGLIHELGQWVLKAACSQAYKWHQSGLELQLSVNIANQQLEHGGFYEMLCQVLEDTHFPAEYLTLDLQGSALLEHADNNQILLERIHRLGVQISVDNLAVNHLTLVQLKKFPVDEIKIDRTYIKTVHSRAEDAKITASIIALSRQLGVTVVAEGVELQTQREFLIEHKCECMQGSIFCEAKPAAILTALLKQRFEKAERVAKNRELME